MKFRNRFRTLIGGFCCPEHCFVPQRYVFTFLSFFGGTLSVAMRASIMLIIAYLTMPPDNCNIEYSNRTMVLVKTLACPDGVASSVMELQEFISGIYFVGVFMAHFVGAYCAKHISAKYTLCSSVIVSTVMFITTIPVGCTSGILLLVVQLFFGLGQGLYMPAINELLSKWIPLDERTLLTAIVYTGIQVGVMITFSIMNFSLQRVPWINVVYIFSGVNILWVILWVLFVSDTPQTNRLISTTELTYISDNVPKTHKEMATPWKSMLQSIPLWVLCIAQMGHDLGVFSLITLIPNFYFHLVHSDLTKIGVVSSVPFLAMYVTTVLIGYICNKLIVIKFASTTTIRKAVSMIGSTFTGIGMVLASYMSDNTSVTICIIISVSFMGAYYSGIRVNTLELSPTHAAMTMAIVCSCGDVFCLLFLFLAKYILLNVNNAELCHENFAHVEKRWHSIFWLMFAILDLSHVPYLLFGSAEVQHWNELPTPRSTNDPSLQITSDTVRS